MSGISGLMALMMTTSMFFPDGRMLLGIDNEAWSFETAPNTHSTGAAPTEFFT